MYFPVISSTAPNQKPTCGDYSTIENKNSDVGPNKLTVLFQTNRNRQNKGFFMVVSCISPDFGGNDGCKQDQANDIPAPSDDDGGKRRKRRKTDMVIQSNNLKSILKQK